MVYHEKIERIEDGELESYREQIKSCDKSLPFAFVSYRRSDANVVFPYVLALQQKGINIWIDKEMKSHTGDDWQKPAFDAIQHPNCRAFLLFVSRNSLTSAPVLAELYHTECDLTTNRHLDELEIKILPVDIDEIIVKNGSVREFLKVNRVGWCEQELSSNDIGYMFNKDSEFIEEKYGTSFDKFIAGMPSEYEIAYRVCTEAGIMNPSKILAQNLGELFESIRTVAPEVVLGVTTNLERLGIALILYVESLLYEEFKNWEPDSEYPDDTLMLGLSSPLTDFMGRESLIDFESIELTIPQGDNEHLLWTRFFGQVIKSGRDNQWGEDYHGRDNSAKGLLVELIERINTCTAYDIMEYDETKQYLYNVLNNFYLMDGCGNCKERHHSAAERLGVDFLFCEQYILDEINRVSNGVVGVMELFEGVRIDGCHSEMKPFNCYINKDIGNNIYIDIINLIAGFLRYTKDNNKLSDFKFEAIPKDVKSARKIEKILSLVPDSESEDSFDNINDAEYTFVLKRLIGDIPKTNKEVYEALVAKVYTDNIIYWDLGVGGNGIGEKCEYADEGCSLSVDLSQDSVDKFLKTGKLDIDEV